MKAAHNDSRSKMSVVIPKYCTGDLMHIRYSANGKKRMAADLALKMTLPIGFAIVGIGYAIYILGNPNSTSFDMASNGLLFILVCGVSFCGCRAMFLIWCMKYAVYTFTDMGLIVDFPLLGNKLVPWKEFKRTCIVYKNDISRKPYISCICCVKKGVNRDSYGMWSVFDIYHYDSVFAFEFTDEVLAGFMEKCPYALIDERNSKAYKRFNPDKVEIGLSAIREDYAFNRLRNNNKNLYVLIEYDSSIQGIGHSVYLHNKIKELADIDKTLEEKLPKDLYESFQGAARSINTDWEDECCNRADEYFRQNYIKMINILDQEALLYLEEHPDYLNNYSVNYMQNGKH